MFHTKDYFKILGDLERLYLVLREKVAVKKMKARDARNGGATADPDPVAVAVAPVAGPSFQRGVKRDASADGCGTPSKKR